MWEVNKTPVSQGLGVQLCCFGPLHLHFYLLLDANVIYKLLLLVYYSVNLKCNFVVCYNDCSAQLKQK